MLTHEASSPGEETQPWAKEAEESGETCKPHPEEDRVDGLGGRSSRSHTGWQSLSQRKRVTDVLCPTDQLAGH